MKGWNSIFLILKLENKYNDKKLMKVFKRPSLSMDFLVNLFPNHPLKIGLSTELQSWVVIYTTRNKIECECGVAKIPSIRVRNEIANV